MWFNVVFFADSHMLDIVFIEPNKYQVGNIGHLRTLKTHHPDYLCYFTNTENVSEIISIASALCLFSFVFSFLLCLLLCFANVLCLFIFSIVSVSWFSQCSMPLYLYILFPFVYVVPFANVLCLFIFFSFLLCLCLVLPMFYASLSLFFLFFCVCGSVLPMLYASLFKLFSFILSL